MTAISSDADELEHRQLTVNTSATATITLRPSRIRRRTRERQSHLFGRRAVVLAAAAIARGRSGGTA
ncbi:MAG: hypothetical protein E6K99_04745 [Thaumarchaeota archaeon]|nr:MAG: hypothetical protein E6K99_04745 [Nitrososphaerota archaeon]